MKTNILLSALAVSHIIGQTVAVKPKQQPISMSGVIVGKHQMGESFIRWLASSEIDLTTECPPKVDDPDYYRRPYRPGLDSNFKVAEQRLSICLLLMPILYTGTGEFTDKKDSLASNKPDPFIVKSVFSNGRLALYEFVYTKSDMQQHLRFITEAYGAPALRKLVDYQNGYGVVWKRLEVEWHTSDGGRITLDEFSGFNDAGQFMVIFASGEAIRKEAAEPEKKKINPYSKE